MAHAEGIRTDTECPFCHPHSAAEGKRHYRMGTSQHRAQGSAAGPKRGQTHELPLGGGLCLKKQTEEGSQTESSYFWFQSAQSCTYQHYCPLSSAHRSQSGLLPLSVSGGNRREQGFLLDHRMVSCPHASTYTITSFRGRGKPTTYHSFDALSLC